MEEARQERNGLSTEMTGFKESIEKIEMDIGLIKAEVLPFEQIY